MKRFMLILALLMVLLPVGSAFAADERSQHQARLRARQPPRRISMPR